MVQAGKSDIAASYLKKTILEQSRNFKLQAMIMQAASTLVQETSFSLVAFLQLVRQTPLKELTTKTFDSLVLHLGMKSVSVDRIIEVFEAFVGTTCFKDDPNTWIKYYGFAKKAGKLIQAEICNPTEGFSWPEN